MFFSSLPDKNFETDEKNSRRISESIILRRSINWCDSKHNRQYKTNFTFSRVFLEKIGFGLLLSCLVLSHSS